jgi:plastocyanin
MRRAALITAAILAVTVAPADAANTDVTVANFAFEPMTVNIAPGDSVTWRFTGQDRNHSATSDPGQAESWDSDPGNPFPNHSLSDTFTHTFNATGSFGYFCKVHTYMRARVVVSAPGAPPPPGGTGGGGPPPPAGDTAAPQLGNLKANARRRRVTFKLDEAASVSARLRGPTRRNYTVNGKSGTNVLRLPSRMRAGRHTVTLTATDAAGNKSPAARVAVSVRRR